MNRLTSYVKKNATPLACATIVGVSVGATAAFLMYNYTGRDYLIITKKLVEHMQENNTARLYPTRYGDLILQAIPKK